MKKKLLYILIVSFFAIYGVRAQVSYPRYFHMENVSVQRSGNGIKLEADIFADLSRLSSQMMVEVTPMLVNGTDTLVFESRAVAGKKRYTSIERQEAFDKKEGSHIPENVSKVSRRSEGDYRIDITTEYRDWMSESQFILSEKVSGCRKWGGYTLEQQVGDPLLPRPSFRLDYAQAPVEDVKLRSETYAAFINFELAKHKLLPDYKNNPKILAEVDEIVTELSGDANLRITRLEVTGYASPEGSYSSNMILSENRANAFVHYLKEKYGTTLPSAQMEVSWKGEDWEGLHNQIEASKETYRNEVLQVLEEKDNLRRKQRLHKLAGGSTYSDMLIKYYPILRRTEYTISYVSKPFTLNEAREVIRNKPQYLSLREMYDVASSYPVGSTEYEEAMAVISKFYPHDQTVITNSAIRDMEQGMYLKAVSKLQGIQTPEGLNSLGVAYYNTGEWGKAEQAFEKAVSIGSETASVNLQMMKKSLSNLF